MKKCSKVFLILFVVIVTVFMSACSKESSNKEKISKESNNEKANDEYISIDSYQKGINSSNVDIVSFTRTINENQLELNVIFAVSNDLYSKFAKTKKDIYFRIQPPTDLIQLFSDEIPEPVDPIELPEGSNEAGLELTQYIRHFKVSQTFNMNEGLIDDDRQKLLVSPDYGLHFLNENYQDACIFFDIESFTRIVKERHAEIEQ